MDREDIILMKRLCPPDFFCEYLPTPVDSRYPIYKLEIQCPTPLTTLWWTNGKEIRIMCDFTSIPPNYAMLACTLDS
jgi:hypothetical protein